MTKLAMTSLLSLPLSGDALIVPGGESYVVGHKMEENEQQNQDNINQLELHK